MKIIQPINTTPCSGWIHLSVGILLCRSEKGKYWNINECKHQKISLTTDTKTKVEDILEFDWPLKSHAIIQSANRKKKMLTDI